MSKELTIQDKLCKRMITRCKKEGIYRKNLSTKCFIGWYYNADDIQDISYTNWLIDGYIMLFHSYLDKLQLKACLEFLDSKDYDNLIIGMNMLYNIKIKSIK